MRKLAYLGLLAILGGCAGVYDGSAVPSAKANLDLERERCLSARASYPTHSAAIECWLAAERNFAVAIKLKKMDLYDAYAARTRLIAAQEDQGTITRDEAGKRASVAYNDYVASIDQAAAIDAQQRAQAAAAMAAVGAAMERQADRNAYIQANQPKPMNCTTTGFGNTLQTHCY